VTSELKYDDEQLILMIQSGGLDFELASMQLFKEFQGFLPQVKAKLRLSQASAQDAYADALVKLIRQLRDGTFRSESKLSSYFYSIYYNTAVDVSRKNTTNKNKTAQSTQELLEHDAKETDLLTLISNRDEVEQVLMVMEAMGEQCQRILMDWGYYGYSMSEIAERAKLSNPESARSMKYKCLKKLRELLNSKLYKL